MTVQEFYDQLSDEELKEALIDWERLKEITKKHSSLLGIEPAGLIEKVASCLIHQAATRWLKNQKP